MVSKFKKTILKTGSLGIAFGTMAFSMVSPTYADTSGKYIFSRYNHQQTIAVKFTIPNFTPKIRIKSNTLYVEIPEALIEAQINEIIRRNEGKVRDTRREKTSFSNTTVALTNEGFRIKGDWNTKRRLIECILRNPITGRCVREGFTPWVSASGSFKATFKTSVNEGVLYINLINVDATGSRWYSRIGKEIFSYFKGKVVNKITESLQTINGLSFKDIAVKYGSEKVSERFSINQEVAANLINRYAKTLHGRFSSTGLTISIDLVPSTISREMTTLQGNAPTSWGSWQAPQKCPSGTYVAGYRMKVESWQRSGDDTALNAVEFACYNRQGSPVSNIKSNEGRWGDWSRSFASCPKGHYFKGFDIKSEKWQRSGDDTAANSVKFVCTNGSVLEASNPGRWGRWTGMKHCPSGSAITGIKALVEPSIGKGDDTALNNIAVICSSL